MLDRAQLYPLLDAYLDGELPLYELRGRFYSGDIHINSDVEDGIYRGVSMHMAMFTAGTWSEEELKQAITWHLFRRDGEESAGPIPMLDKQWMDIMSSGMAPWPLKVEGLRIDD